MKLLLLSNINSLQLVYMHLKTRYNYLHPNMEDLRNRIDQLALSQQNPKLLDKLSSDLLECEQYDLVLTDKADQQIEFDLDDGVTENLKLFDGVVKIP